MKKRTLLLLLFACLSINIVQAKDGKPYPKSLKKSNYFNNAILLTAELTNFKGTSVLMIHNNKLNEEVTDTLSVSNGKFTVPAGLIPKPQIAILFIIINNQWNQIPVMLAPSYQLAFKTDVKSWTGRNTDIHWSGKGSLINDFYTEVNNHPQDYAPDKAPFDNWYRSSQRTSDSLISKYAVYYNDIHDPNYAYFTNLIDDEIKFSRLNALLGNAFKLLNTEAPADVDKYLINNFDSKVLNDLSNSNNLASPAFKNLAGFSYWYLYYRLKYDNKVSNTISADQYGSLLKKIDAIFKGDVRDFVFYRFVKFYLDGIINTYEKFKADAKTTMPYLDSIQSKFYRDKLISLINKKQYELSKYRIGDTAQAFSLVDNNGNRHTLADFKGKVVLIDFWASSCAPCREETPYLNKLYKKYKADSRVEFVSIAVRDKNDAWQQALRQDKPEWLQLFDGEGKTSNYFTNTIPKFVLIDQAGLIINLDAPEPSNADKLETLIKTQLEKYK